jgi:endonuclease/exonuclease/phosphatase (EEP) superfamily protein YafD
MAVGQGFLGFGLVAVGVVASLATVLAFFGSTWWLFDFAANFRAHLAVVLVIVALGYALLFSKATALFFMLMAGVNAIVILPLYMGSPAPATGTDSLTVVSFNVDQKASIRDTAYGWINTVDPDIVVLTEATEAWTQPSDNTGPYHTLNDLPIDRTFGIAVMARENLDVELIQVTQVRDSLLRIVASIGDRPIVIYAVQSRVSSNEKDAALQQEYFAEVASLARQETDPTIIVGDFQSSPWSHTFQTLLTDAHLVDSLIGFGIQTTWPANRWAFFRLPFDNLIHSEDLTTVDRYLGPAFGTDHLPIVVTLAMAA